MFRGSLSLNVNSWGQRKVVKGLCPVCLPPWNHLFVGCFWKLGAGSDGSLVWSSRAHLNILKRIAMSVWHSLWVVIWTWIFIWWTWCLKLPWLAQPGSRYCCHIKVHIIDLKMSRLLCRQGSKLWLGWWLAGATALGREAANKYINWWLREPFSA